MKKLIFLLSIIFFFMSCSRPTYKNTIENSGNKNELTNIKWSSNDKNYWNSIAIAKINLLKGPNNNIPIYKNNNTIPELAELSNRVGDRHYVNFNGLSYNIAMIPGNILKFDKDNQSYSLVSQVNLLKNNKQPQMQLIPEAEGVNYSNKIVLEDSTYGSVLFGNASYAKNTLLEVTVQDMASSVAVDSLVDTAALNKIIRDNPPEILANLFFIKSALLTSSSYRNSHTVKFNARINFTYITAQRQTYGSSGEFTRLRLISLDMISLKDMVH